MRLIAASLLAVLGACAAAAQPPHAAPTVSAAGERMAPLAPLVGEWRGSGWTLLPSGGRETFSSHETVTRRLSGNALLVEGQHRGANGALVHDAMAMLVWDQRSGGYRMRTQLANGMGGDFPLEVTPGGFTWRIDTPSGRIEYIAQFTADTWTERGRRIGPDGQSVDFFEMSLRRER